MLAMPIIRSAKKALRSSARKRQFNLVKKNALNVAVKKIKKLVADKKRKEAEVYFKDVQKIIDKATKTGLIKKNTAARKKSNLVAAIKKIS